jgi:NAD(P)-dependent dehydrogenase (short-subunit alcohol dehydrogenase family)
VSLGQELGAHPLLVDATDFASVEAAAAEAREALGGLNGMVNCVGSVFLKPAHLTKPEEWHQVIADNLTSAFGMVRAAGSALRESGGSVVLVASGAARVGLPNHEAIAAAKGGVIGLTRSAAATYAKAGIQFNAVAPGLVRTPATARITERPGALSASVALHPLGRIGEATEVASVIRWLLEPSQSWITGQVIGVDGGLADLKVG